MRALSLATLSVALWALPAGAVGKSGGFSATVESVALKNAVELKVTGADGAVRTVQKVPLTDSGRVSSTELVAATSVVIQAIENPADFKKAKAEKSDPGSKTVAKKHTARPIRIAARGHNPRG